MKEGKLEEPFKCFIYCTGVKNMNLKDYVKLHAMTNGAVDDWHGKVIGEFMCDGIYRVCYTMDGFADMVDCDTTCMKPSDFIKYGRGKRLYKWYISQVKAYDKPKDLSAFCYPPEKYCEKGLCGGCPYYSCPNEYGEYKFDCEWERPLRRAPQSWCYVDEVQRQCNIATVAEEVDLW